MTAPATILILLVTAAATFAAFRRPDWRDRWLFKPLEILRYKQYDRLLTSGFIHADWMHFCFNAFSFWAFGQIIEITYGSPTLLLVYFSSILGGSLLSLLIHRHHEYSALGASGGVCGVIFAAIFLLPGMGVHVFLIPIGIPAYIYAPAFLILSFIAHRRGRDNIGHDAHLGGAIVGLLIAAACYPSLILAAPVTFGVVLGLSILVLVALIYDPFHLLSSRLNFGEQPRPSQRFQVYDENRQRNRKLAQIDRLLDKVSSEGIHKLSDSERKKLEQLSKEMGGRR